MRKINLGIKIDDLVPEAEFKDKTGINIAEKFIISAFNWIQSTPKNHGDTRSAGLTVAEHRKINAIFIAIKTTTNSIIELDDKIYEFLKSSFNKVQWIGGTEIVVRIADAIDNAFSENE